MAKRIADKVLTDRNWDQEDEAEEAGTFSLASDDVLKSRAIKKAKRRNAGKEADGGGAFKGFKGFSLTPSTPAAGASFGGFGNLAGFSSLTSSTKDSTASVTTSCGGFSSPATNKDPVTGSLSFNGGASSSFSSSFSKPTCGSDVTQNGSASSPAIGSDSGKNSSSSISSEEYDGQVIALNCSVRDWIIKHVNDNPLCDLNPIFRDYELHLASIVKKYGSGAAEQENAGAKPESRGEEKRGLQASVSTAAATPSCPSSSSSSSAGTVTPVKSSVPTGVTFNFGQKVDSSVLGSLASAASSGFSFTTSSSSSSSSSTSLFGGAASNTQTADQNGADEESEEPPVPVVKEIKEKDAFYSKKCKLFYKKESEFKEKGVGTLHLKMVSEGKLQLLVRADTNLGNILLNIMVTSTMPCSRTGKNNVMVVCVPNPAVDVKNPTTPVPMLIRVKTAEDADELHKILQEKKA